MNMEEGRNVNPPDAVFCSNCGREFKSGEMFCGNCGTARPNAVNICPNCGAEIRTGQTFCSNCGFKTKTDAPDYSGAITSKLSRVMDKVKNDKKIMLTILGVVVLIISVFVVHSLTQSVNLEKLYNEYCDSEWATIDSSGEKLTIDTNPYDWDDDGNAYPQALEAIKDVNEALGLDESLMDEFMETRAIDGLQRREYDKVTVLWTYHPSEGLEVVYIKGGVS